MICPIRIIVNDCIFMSIGKIIHPIKSHSGALVSRQVSSLLRVLAAPFALWVALQSIQPGNLLSLGCNGESFSKKTSEKQSRNWNRIALYNGRFQKISIPYHGRL